MSEIEMTIDAVRDIANRTMGALKQQAEGSSRAFGDVDLPPAAFGGWNQAIALGRHHRAAHEVFMKTLEGVLADLEEFAQNLRDTADSSERRDEEVQASLLAMSKGYRERIFRSQQNYTATVEALSGVEGVQSGDLAADVGEQQADVVGEGSEPGAGSDGAATQDDSSEAPPVAGPADSSAAPTDDLAF